MNFLQKFLRIKRQELQKFKEKRSLERIEKEAIALSNKRDIRNFRDIFIQTTTLALIAEIKLKSPTTGLLTKLNHLEIGQLYAQSTADAISILTDEAYFNGNIVYIKEVRELAPQPLLRKDFIIETYQIYETFIAFADAFLLIASILSTKQIKDFLALGRLFRLEALVEVHNEEELEKACEAGAEIIGINNRDLKTLKVDMKTMDRLVKLIPKGKIIVSESGITDAQEVQKLMTVGVKGILVGTSILKSEYPLKKIAELKFPSSKLIP